MSLFNQLFGSFGSDMTPLFMEMLGLETVGRSRGAWIEEQDGEPVIAIYTRNGAGNREHWEDGESGIDCPCTGCVQTYYLPANPYYISDADDEFDYTYCTTWFRVPDQYKAELRDKAIERPDIAGNWQAVFDALQALSVPKQE
mgnify:CR=1 FL=1